MGRFTSQPKEPEKTVAVDKVSDTISPVSNGAAKSNKTEPMKPQKTGNEKQGK
jgi:hypothetical protein